MTRTLCAWLLFVVAALFSSCADTGSKERSEDRVSTIPWNRPEKWEGAGALGGFMPPR
jgi:hypothetical protein